TTVVDHLALRVEHVVVFELALSDGEVVLLDLDLRALDGFVDPRVGDDGVFFEAEPVHDARRAVGAEEAHQVVFEGDVELAFTGVTLAAGPASELEVDAAAFVPFGAENGEAAKLADAGTE